VLAFILTLGLFSDAAVTGPILFLISAAIVINACSTLVAFFALVSKNGMPIESANSWKNKVDNVKKFYQLVNGIKLIDNKYFLFVTNSLMIKPIIQITTQIIPSVSH